MLADSERYEAKRAEVDAWLSRMELRFARMPPVGNTADVLEAQMREQKAFHAELHQYKHHIELFSQLTQKLIAVYQQDDTSRVKRTTEAINQRYEELNSSIINRGKGLHSAINSLHNFDRSLEKFLAWLSEVESGLEAVETEADREGKPSHQLKVAGFHSSSHGQINSAGAEKNIPEFTSASDWPSESPDLNPLDYQLWSKLERMACHRAHPNLEQSLVRAVERFPQKVQCGTIDDWPRR
ncbi:unnamed protein product [Nezara viridula]|uniref:Dystrophin n=1 Tax=Nezara viridula TaxID=85310 RepID=A0A9P0HJF3_NEZVI|nr:unnamed protein product [Nezara viridula]